MRNTSISDKIAFVVASLVTLIGFLLLFGTAGTIDRLPSEQLPTSQMILQCVVSVVMIAAGSRWLNGYYDKW